VDNLGIRFPGWAPGAPGKRFTGSWQKSAKNISPGLLTTSGEMTILQDEALKLPENLSLSRFQEAGGFLHGPGSWDAARIRKEKNGLAIRTANTCEVGIDPDCSVFPGYAYFITPQTPKLPNEPSVEVLGSGAAGQPGARASSS
tara:strand:+ start:144 stop:575 length:432 start_codon:yes stop_codon:yes gene_type:complete